MTKLYHLVCLFSLLAASGCSTLRTSVLFGERASYKDIQELPSGLAAPYKANVSDLYGIDTSYHLLRIFVDREGVIYPPNLRILDSLLIGNNYTLLPSNELERHRSQEKIIKFLETQLNPANDPGYFKILNEYYSRTDHTIFTQKEFREKFNQISADLLVKSIQNLRIKHRYNDITFLFVGINNTFINGQTSNNSSEAKLGFQRQRIQDILDERNYRNLLDVSDKSDLKKTLFVEVHWDGRFTSQKGVKTARNYTAGLISSYKAGLALRPILSGLDDSALTINMMSHSSGANVICESLFNQETKIRAYSKKTATLWQFLDLCYKDPKAYYHVPEKSKVNAFLLEASLPGVETFQDYYLRNHLRARPKIDNYKITVGYNVNDPDLGKRFGRKWVGKLVTAVNYNNRLINGLGDPFGSTSLGALGTEIIKTKELFRKYYDVNKFAVVNFSYSDANGHQSPNTFHDMAFYLNLPLYKKTIQELYGF